MTSTEIAKTGLGKYEPSKHNCFIEVKMEKRCKKIISEFEKASGVAVVWCKLCEVHTVVCPCCQAKACSQGCRNGGEQRQFELANKLSDLLEGKEPEVNYTYDVDNGLSWRDCPTFRVFADGKLIYISIGGKESAIRWIEDNAT